jgi:DNA replication protein DnaC
MNTMAEIHTLAKQLSLSHLANKTFDFLSEPLENEAFLLCCLKEEIEYREQKTRERRIKQAQLPTYKAFETFDTDFQKGITDWQLNQLAGLNWIDSIYNLILIGPPGTGKTHIALAIGNKALESGYKVFFASMDTLVHILKTQEISRNSAARLKYIKNSDLLIIDELGYLPIGKVEANLFFQLVSQLYENTSVVITSNKGFDGWAGLLGDAVLATALLDRLTHKCQVLSLMDDSYRLAHRKQIFDHN